MSSSMLVDFSCSLLGMRSSCTLSKYATGSTWLLVGKYFDQHGHVA